MTAAALASIIWESQATATMIQTTTLKFNLDHLLTQWDIKQSKNKYYNPYALGIYLARAEDLIESVNKGATISEAIDTHFNDRLAAMLHKKLT